MLVFYSIYSLYLLFTYVFPAAFPPSKATQQGNKVESQRFRGISTGFLFFSAQEPIKGISIYS